MATPPEKRARTDGPAPPQQPPSAPQTLPGSESAWSEMARQQEWVQMQQQRQHEAQEAVQRQQAALDQEMRKKVAMEKAAEAARLQMEAKQARKAERDKRRKEEAEKERIRKLEEEAIARQKAIEEAKRKQEAAAKARQEEREKRKADKDMEEAPMPGDYNPEDDLGEIELKGKSQSAIFKHYLKIEKKKLQAEKDLHLRELSKQKVVNLEKLRFYSPLAAGKMEEEARERQRIEDEKAKRREAAIVRRQKLEKQRQKREAQAAIDHQKAVKDMQEKQAALQEQRVAMLADQLRLDHEARLKAEERESKQMKKLKGAGGPKKDAPLRRVIRDEDKLRELFGAIPSLPAYGPRRAYCAGEICRVDDERGDGTVLLRFEDGFISWFPKRALIGFEDCPLDTIDTPAPANTKPDNFCDVCEKVCIPTPASRPRVCGDREQVYRIYVQMWELGGLPAWNPRGVPNPRRAYCPGAEANIEDEDKASGKVKLRFDDDFVTWFPKLALQGEKTKAEKENQKQVPTSQEKVDPFGWNECVPDIEALTTRGAGLLSEGAEKSFAAKLPRNPNSDDFAALARANVAPLNG